MKNTSNRIYLWVGKNMVSGWQRIISEHDFTILLRKCLPKLTLLWIVFKFRKCIYLWRFYDGSRPFLTLLYQSLHAIPCMTYEHDLPALSSEVGTASRKAEKSRGKDGKQYYIKVLFHLWMQVGGFFPKIKSTFSPDLCMWERQHLTRS